MNLNYCAEALSFPQSVLSKIFMFPLESAQFSESATTPSIAAQRNGTPSHEALSLGRAGLNFASFIQYRLQCWVVVCLFAGFSICENNRSWGIWGGASCAEERHRPYLCDENPPKGELAQSTTCVLTHRPTCLTRSKSLTSKQSAMCL